MEGKKRIFLGFSEVANFISNYKKGFETLGHTTYTVVGSRNRYYPNAKYDIVMSDLIQVSDFWPALIGKIIRSIKARFWAFIIFFKALRSCDVFYYNTGGHSLPYALDLRLIRFFRKKLVVLYLGSEIRHWYAYEQEMRKLGFAEMFADCIQSYREQKYGGYLEKLERVRKSEKYAHLILSQPGFAQLQSKPYMRLFVGLSLADYKFNVPKRETPLIVHAPSSRGIKGTCDIEAALSRLKNEGIQFDFKLIENMANEDLLKLLTESDILIDELNSDTIGVLSTEGMATGNAVLTGYLAEFVKVPQPCPVINTNRSNVYNNIKTLILDIDLRVKLANDGLIYVEKHHDIAKIASRELDLLFSSKPIDYDFRPTFYRSLEIPTSILVEERG